MPRTIINYHQWSKKGIVNHDDDNCCIDLKSTNTRRLRRLHRKEQEHHHYGGRGCMGNTFWDTLQVRPCRLGASIPDGYGPIMYYPYPRFEFIDSGCKYNYF